MLNVDRQLLRGLLRGCVASFRVPASRFRPSSALRQPIPSLPTPPCLSSFRRVVVVVFGLSREPEFHFALIERRAAPSRARERASVDVSVVRRTANLVLHDSSRVSGYSLCERERGVRQRGSLEREEAATEEWLASLARSFARSLARKSRRSARPFSLST